MNSDQSLDGLLRYLKARWPPYAAAITGILLALFLLPAAIEGGNGLLTGLGLVFLFLLVYFVTTSLWAAHEQFGRRRSLPSHTIFELGQVQPIDRIVYVGLGTRDTPIQLSRRLTRGRVEAIDVYNPQLSPGRALARLRRETTFVQPDPRLQWLEGTLSLLPLPDNSVPLVACSYTLFELWQDGDRRLLLKEMRRILEPGGFLLLAEPARTRTQLLTVGPAALRLPAADYWRGLLKEAGFHLTREKSINDYYLCFRAEKPFPGTVQQLALDLGI